MLFNGVYCLIYCKRKEGNWINTEGIISMWKEQQSGTNPEHGRSNLLSGIIKYLFCWYEQKNQVLFGWPWFLVHG